MSGIKPENRLLYHSGSPILEVQNGDVTGHLFIKPEGSRLMNELGDAIYIKPQTVKYHAHLRGAETFLMLQGSVQMHINHKKCSIVKGDLMHIRSHVHHGFSVLETDTTWREMFQDIDMYSGILGKANLRDYTPELLEDEEFSARRLHRVGTDYRDAPPLEECNKYNIHQVKPADKPMLTFDVPVGMLHMRVSRWELDGVKEIWQFDLNEGSMLDFSMPFADSPLYHIIEGSLHVDSDRESFDASEGDIIKIPPYLRHKLTASKNVKILALNVQSYLLNIMECLHATKVRNPEKLEDWNYISKVLKDNNCWLTGYTV